MKVMIINCPLCGEPADSKAHRPIGDKAAYFCTNTLDLVDSETAVAIFNAMVPKDDPAPAHSGPMEGLPYLVEDYAHAPSFNEAIKAELQGVAKNYADTMEKQLMGFPTVTVVDTTPGSESFTVEYLPTHGTSDIVYNNKPGSVVSYSGSSTTDLAKAFKHIDYLGEVSKHMGIKMLNKQLSDKLEAKEKKKSLAEAIKKKLGWAYQKEDAAFGIKMTNEQKLLQAEQMAKAMDSQESKGHGKSQWAQSQVKYTKYYAPFAVSKDVFTFPDDAAFKLLGEMAKVAQVGKGKSEPAPPSPGLEESNTSWPPLSTWDEAKV